MSVNIALNIRKLRHWRELKQAYVADQSGMSKRTYSDIETGNSRALITHRPYYISVHKRKLFNIHKNASSRIPVFTKIRDDAFLYLAP